MPTILTDGTNTADIARRLLDAAGDNPGRVQVVTSGAYPAFAVDDDLAAAAGFGSDDGDDKKPEPRKRKPRAAADNTDD